MEKKPHVNLIIATPGHSVMSTYARSLLATTQMLSSKGITWAWSSEYSSHVADAREMTLNGDNQNDPAEQRPFKGNVTYDKILWIDSDIAFTPEDVLKLYESDYDVVSGAYLLANGEAVVYKELFGPGYTYDEVLKMEEPVEVFGAGFGFIMVKQGIFEKLTRPWFQSTMATSVAADGTEFTFPIMGEDLSWCKRVGDLGFKIWFDPTVRVTHHKTMKLTWEGIKI
jgi:hypothetical protein